jgi:putative flippase GtrA
MINHLSGDKLQNFPNSLISNMLKLFARYTSIGVINTLIHWVVFAICIYVFHTSQALANFAGFVVAVSFSFFANARFTFKARTTTMRYMLYVGFMGTLSAAVGWEADKVSLAPIATLVVFSAISLICGFIYSKYIVFRDAK